MKKFLLAFAAGCVLTFSAFVLLSAGVWNFELQASKDGTLYEATVNEFELVSSTNTVTFALNLAEDHYEGNGQISLTLTYEDGSS